MNEMSEGNSGEKAVILAGLLTDPGSYKTDIEQFISWCDDQDYPYEGSVLEEFVEYLMASGYSASTIHRRFYGCAAILRQELESRQFEHEDMRRLALYNLDRAVRVTKLPKRNTFAVKPSKYFELEEIKTLIKNSDRRTGMLIEFLYATGIRVAELVGIRMSHVRKESTRMFSIRIMGKGRKERIVFINSGMYRRIQAAFPGKKTWLFETTNRTPYEQGNIRKLLRKAGKDILNRNLSPHCLRHSFASHKIKETGKITGVSHALGHSDISVTLAEYNNELLNPEEFMHSGLYGKKGIRDAE